MAQKKKAIKKQPAPLSNAERQRLYRERKAESGYQPVSLPLPGRLIAKLDKEAARRGLTRAALIEEKLEAKPLAATPLPKEVEKEATRIVRLIERGLRATYGIDDAAGEALNDAMNAIYELAGMAAERKQSRKKR